MRIIVCGAGRIGKSIVSYLSQGNNDIVVIDNDQRRLDEISKEWDVMPIFGPASHPEILEKAGAMNADLILALTNVDEVNLIACQVADYLFHVRKKLPVSIPRTLWIRCGANSLTNAIFPLI